MYFLNAFKIAELFTSALTKSRGYGKDISFEIANVCVNQWKTMVLDLALNESAPSVLIGLEEVFILIF